MTSFFDIFSGSGGVQVEIIRLVYLLSLIISLWVYYEKEHTPGGIITVGSVLLLLSQPIRILFLLLTTALIIPLQEFIESKLLKKMILVSRDRMLLRVLTSIVISAILYIVYAYIFPQYPVGILGTVGPALLAAGLSNPVRRKGTLISFSYAVILGICMYVAIKFIYMFLVPAGYIALIEQIYNKSLYLDFWSVLILYFLFAAITIYNFYARRAKTLAPVGMMIGGYLGLLILSPLHIAFVIFVAMSASSIVHVIDKMALLYGYRLFVLSSLIASSIYIFTEMLTIYYFDFHPLKGITLAGMIVCSVITSELSQNEAKKVTLSYISMFIFAGVLFLSVYLLFILFAPAGTVLPSIFQEFIL